MSVSKKNKLLLRIFLPLDLLDAHVDNPNKMSEREFDLLVANVDSAGFTDPMLTWPGSQLQAFEQVLKDWAKLGKALPSQGPDEEFNDYLRASGVRFTLLGGHHRRDALQYLGEASGFTTTIIDPEFTEEDADAQLLRNNVIKGKIDGKRLTAMVERYLTKGYGLDTIQELFGFSDESEFKKLIQDTAKTLPKEMQKPFLDAAAEIKTIDGLSKLLNRMFTQFGDTLPYGYLVIDYGGQQSLWLRASKKTYDAVTLIGQACVESSVTLDDVLGSVLQSIAKGEAGPLVKAALDKAKPVVIPANFVALPTADTLEKVNSL